MGAEQNFVGAVSHDLAKASYGLPDDLVDAAVRRLKVLSLSVGILLCVSVSANTAFHFFSSGVPFSAMAIGLRLFGAVLAFVTYAVCRSPRFRRDQKMRMGLVLEVGGAYGITIVEHVTLVAADMPVGIIPLIAVWMLVFRFVVPTAARPAAVVSILDVSAVPVALWLGAMFWGHDIPVLRQAIMVWAAVIVAVIAWLVSRAIYSLGTAVSEARDIGTYHLQERLGVGGMGEVWRASHAMLKRPAAVKLIRPERLGGDGTGRDILVQRFEREARATASLHSSHTVHLYDFGVTAEGSFYYVMEMLDGVDLDTLIERFGPLEPERAVYLLMQVCHSLIDAHGAGLVHRDIKPANIFCCRLGPDDDYVKVLDFGLVKDVSTEGAEGDGLTRDQTITGTPAFLAPEVAVGKPVQPAADLYAVGCVAYWLLTGRLVFEADSAIETVARHIRDEPAPPSALTEMEIPAALDALILHLLAKDPEARPASALEVRDTLDAIAMAKPWSQSRAHAWWDRHRPTVQADPA